MFQGTNPGWYLDRVAVYNLQSQSDDDHSYFFANKWLAFDLPPYTCYVELEEATYQDLMSVKTLWRANFFNEIQEENEWTSMFSRFVFSNIKILFDFYKVLSKIYFLLTLKLLYCVNVYSHTNVFMCSKLFDGN